VTFSKGRRGISAHGRLQDRRPRKSAAAPRASRCARWCSTRPACTGGGACRFGFFDQLPLRARLTERQRYDDILAQIELATGSGTTPLARRTAFQPAFSVLANPLWWFAAAAQRTSRIRSARRDAAADAQPGEIAEDAATADLLSGGRLEFGVAAHRAIALPGYDIPMEESASASTGARF